MAAVAPGAVPFDSIRTVFADVSGPTEFLFVVRREFWESLPYRFQLALASSAADGATKSDLHSVEVTQGMYRTLESRNIALVKLSDKESSAVRSASSPTSPHSSAASRTLVSADGSVPLVCVPLSVTACGADDECQRGTAASINLPHFLQVDVKAMTIRAVEQGRQSPIGSATRLNGHLILQGVQGAHGWTLIIAEDTGQMSATIAGAVTGDVIFGSCTQLTQGGGQGQ
jgi:hypothetical protein